MRPALAFVHSRRGYPLRRDALLEPAKASLQTGDAISSVVKAVLYAQDCISKAENAFLQSGDDIFGVEDVISHAVGDVLHAGDVIFQLEDAISHAVNDVLHAGDVIFKLEDAIFHAVNDVLHAGDVIFQLEDAFFHAVNDVFQKRRAIVRLDTILDAIGNTPLVRLHRIPSPGTAEVWVKLEAFNPGGSAKDRPARSMIEDAEKRGLLKPGATIVEPTGGNTGIGLALVAAVKGYKCVLVCPRGTSAEKIALMRAFGAEVIEARPDVDPEHEEGYIGRAERTAKERGAFHPDQFSNAANPRAHVESTAEEILRDLDGRLDAFVACVGSGGTLSGVGKALKARLPALRLVRVAPLSGTGAPGVARQPTAIEGVSAFEPDEAFGCPAIDEVAEVLDADAFAIARRMAREEGLLVGGSSGAAVSAALRIAKGLPPTARVVALCADTGRNYLGGFLK